MIRFLSIKVQLKGHPIDNDWRTFLDWVDSETNTGYQLRGCSG